MQFLELDKASTSLVSEHHNSNGRKHIQTGEVMKPTQIKRYGPSKI